MVSSTADAVLHCENPQDEDIQTFLKVCENLLEDTGNLSDRSIIHILDRFVHVFLKCEVMTVRFLCTVFVASSVSLFISSWGMVCVFEADQSGGQLHEM